MKKLLIIEKSPSGAMGLKKAKSRGCYVIFIGSDKYHNKATQEDQKFIDEMHFVDTNDRQKVLAIVDDIARRHTLDGVFTFMEFYVELAAIVADRLGLNGVPVTGASNARDKMKMRQLFTAAGLEQPRFSVFSTKEELLSQVDDFDYPNIIKPINMSGSRGVIKNNDRNELELNFSELDVLNPLFGVRKEEQYLLEQYIPGEEFSVESVTFHGHTTIVSVTKKIVKGGKYFVEIGHISPASISATVLDNIEAVVRKSIAVLGLDNTVTHCELKVDGEHITIIEIAARLGGDHIPELVEKSSGVDLWDCALSISLNEQPCLVKKQARFSAISFITAEEGCIESFNLSTLPDSVAVQEVHKNFKTGDTVRALTCSSDRLGYLILESEKYDEVARLCQIPESLYVIKTI